MKLSLSDAVRLGSLMMPNPGAGETMSCAVGMALLAHGVEPGGAKDYDRLMGIYPWLRRRARHSCLWCGVALRFTGLLAHPFDRHVMTRQITIDALCEWIAAVERRRNRCCEVPLKSNAGLKWGPSLAPVALDRATPTGAVRRFS